MTMKDMQDYAWRWFEYHAGQRLTAFRFFLIIWGIIALGLGNSVSQENVALARAIALSETFLSIAFLILEIRNEQLVNLGRDALKVVESSDDFQPFSNELKLFHKDSSRCGCLSHKFWFRSIYVLSILGFTLVACLPRILMGADN